MRSVLLRLSLQTENKPRHPDPMACKMRKMTPVSVRCPVVNMNACRVPALLLQGEHIKASFKQVPCMDGPHVRRSLKGLWGSRDPGSVDPAAHSLPPLPVFIIAPLLSLYCSHVFVKGGEGRLGGCLRRTTLTRQSLENSTSNNQDGY